MYGIFKEDFTGGGEMNTVKKRHMVPYLFILPAFIIHACIVTGPALSTLVMSLFDWNGKRKIYRIKKLFGNFQRSLGKAVRST